MIYSFKGLTAVGYVVAVITLYGIVARKNKIIKRNYIMSVKTDNETIVHNARGRRSSLCLEWADWGLQLVDLLVREVAVAGDCYLQPKYQRHNQKTIIIITAYNDHQNTVSQNFTCSPT